jgi:hypothetical protein
LKSLRNHFHLYLNSTGIAGVKKSASSSAASIAARELKAVNAKAVSWPDFQTSTGCYPDGFVNSGTVFKQIRPHIEKILRSSGAVSS